MAGNLKFDQAGSAGASIVNEGRISAAEGGLVALVAPSVANAGVITAHLGRVSLASGDKWTLDLYGDNLVSFDVTDQVNGSVANSGKISGGTVELTANAAKGIVGSAIDMSGIVEATGAHEEGGTIVLDGGANGDVSITGHLEARGGAGAAGGTIQVTGDAVALSGAVLDASGGTGGGTIEVGGGAHGAGPLRHAQSVTVDEATRIVADATQDGDGGGITIWSDGATSFEGSASARGGTQGGDGGVIETSGHSLDFAGARIDTGAAAGMGGQTGTWLLDPYDLTINAAGASTIQTNLATSNVTVQTTAATSGTSTTSGFGTVTSGTGGNITVASAITWSSNNSLTLSAYNSILVNAAITDSGTGAIVLRADNAGVGTAVLGTGQGTVTNSASLSTGGAVSIYYDAAGAGTAQYATPATYTGITAGGGATAYMLVDSVSDLNSINNNLGGVYALGGNISSTASINSIGYYTNFSGLFDGNGGLGTNYTISGITILPTYKTGLFSNNAGQIRNVNFNDVTVMAGDNAQDVGVVVGQNNNGYVHNVSVTNALVEVGSNAQNVGGIVGVNQFNGTIDDNWFQGTISVGANAGRIGGILGSNGNGSSNYNNTVAAGSTITVASGSSGIGGIIGSTDGYAGGDSFFGTIVAGAGVSAVGGIAGYNGNGYVQNETFGGTILAAGASQVGGFVGVNESVVTGGTALAGALVSGGSGSSSIGGVVGYEIGGVISGISASDLVIAGSASQSVGGLVGQAAEGTFMGDTITGGLVTVDAGSEYAGGLIGYNNGGTLSDSSFSGTVMAGWGAANIGGLVGINQFDGSVAAIIANSSFFGLVSAGSGANYVGGIVGNNGGGTIANADFTGTVLAGSASFYVGGFAGLNSSYGNAGLITGGTVSGVISAQAAHTAWADSSVWIRLTLRCRAMSSMLPSWRASMRRRAELPSMRAASSGSTSAGRS